MDAYRTLESGQVTQPTTGIPMFTPSNLPAEAAKTALGMRSLERAENERAISVTYGLNEVERRKREKFRRDLEDAIDRGEGIGEVVRAAREAGVVITPEQIRAAKRLRRKTALERVLDRSPKRERREIRERVGSTVVIPPQ